MITPVTYADGSTYQSQGGSWVPVYEVKFTGLHITWPPTRKSRRGRTWRRQLIQSCEQPGAERVAPFLTFSNVGSGGAPLRHYERDVGPALVEPEYLGRSSIMLGCRICLHNFVRLGPGMPFGLFTMRQMTARAYDKNHMTPPCLNNRYVCQQQTLKYLDSTLVFRRCCQNSLHQRSPARRRLV